MHFRYIPGFSCLCFGQARYTGTVTGGGRGLPARIATSLPMLFLPPISINNNTRSNHCCCHSLISRNSTTSNSSTSTSTSSGAVAGYKGVAAAVVAAGVVVDGDGGRRRGGLLLLLLVEVSRIPNQPLAAWNAFQTFMLAFRALVPNGRMLDTHAPLLAFLTIQTSNFPWKLRGHWSEQRQVEWTIKDFLPVVWGKGIRE